MSRNPFGQSAPSEEMRRAVQAETGRIERRPLEPCARCTHQRREHWPDPATEEHDDRFVCVVCGCKNFSGRRPKVSLDRHTGMTLWLPA